MRPAMPKQAAKSYLRTAMPKQAPKSYVRLPTNADDLSLCPEARTVLRSIANPFLPIHLACRFPRVMNRIAHLWHRPAQLDAYFDDLLIDRRGGRQGFPFAVVSELGVLKAYYETQIYPKRECVWQKVYTVPSAPLASAGHPAPARPATAHSTSPT